MSRQILWFRRDLRLNDNAILAEATGEVFPIFIFDTNILKKLPKDDKRVTFIYDSVLKLKEQLKSINLDLAIFFDEPCNVFKKLKSDFNEILCSCDFDSYALSRDKMVEKILPLKRYYDSYLTHPNETLKDDGSPYRVFTPFYNNLKPLWSSIRIKEYKPNSFLKLYKGDYSLKVSLSSMGFIKQNLPLFLKQDSSLLINEFKSKIQEYHKDRDFLYLDATSKLSVYLRFGLISPKEVFNQIRVIKNSDFFIKELFWREFYNSILYHFPKSEFENFNEKKIMWSENQNHFEAWCRGETGVPIVDASMRHLNQTGLMHNRARMLCASFLCKNLFLPWQWGEEYFAKKLLDYDTSSNVGSWQWSASTGADSVPYFRIFNPYLQSKKFDKDTKFIKSILTQYKDIPAHVFHKENELYRVTNYKYPKAIVDIKRSKEEAIIRGKLYEKHKINHL